MIDYPKPLIGFAAYSGSGKTSLLEKLIPILTENAIRVALIKHSHHHFDIDKPGKDSYRLRKAGANQTLVASSKRWALMVEQEPRDDAEPNLRELLQHLDTEKLDLVIVEGFKHEDILKIEVHRPSTQKPLMAPLDQNFIAIACDEAEQIKDQVPEDCEILDLNQVQVIANFLIQRLNLNG